MSEFVPRKLKELSACGKAILFGEHAAVYGRPALAIGLPRAMRPVKLRPSAGPISLEVLPWNLIADEARADPIGDALRRLRRLVPAGNGRGMQVVLESDLPAGGGLGSSAALAVALVRCLHLVRGVAAPAVEVRKLSHELEKVFHGHPSGLDDTVASFGGLCLFQAGGLARLPAGAERLDERTARLAGEVPGLVVGLTGKSSATWRMVETVGELHRRDAPRMEAVFDGIAGCLAAGLAALENRRPDLMGAAMTENHRLLVRLGLGWSEAEAMVGAARACGAMGAKLTGAGGGGAVIALAPGREQELLETWKRMGFDGFAVLQMQGTAGGNAWSAAPRQWPART